MSIARRVIWLVSYPKSGNTWFRFILFYLNHGRQPEDSVELDRFMNSRMPPPDGQPRYMKSHATPEKLRRYFKKSIGAIYIYRHPLDVLQSTLNYALLTGEISEAEKDAWVDTYIETEGHPVWLPDPHNAGTWIENVTSWLNETELPIHYVSYEDTLANPRKAIEDVARFLNIPVDEKLLDECVEATRFEELKAFEGRELDAAKEVGKPLGRFSAGRRVEAHTNLGVRFFNKGTAGSWRSAISRDAAERAWERFSEVATRLGYKFDE
jgi:hypothetical protein